MGTRNVFSAIGGFLILACASTTVAVAQDPDASAATAKKQRAAIATWLKKADFSDAVVAETPRFYVISPSLTPEKAKSLGATLDKLVPTVRKSLQLDENEELVKGKLAVYVFPESRDFKSFMRSVLMVQPDGVHFALRSDEPAVIDPVALSGKATEADLVHNTASVVSEAFLLSRAGTAKLPSWLSEGFGRVTALRVEGVNSKRYQAYKSQAKAAVTGVRTGKPPALMDLWAESRPANADLLANSFAEFLAYSPVSKDFSRVVAGFRPNENGDAPSVPQAFEAAGWKELPMLEAAWRKWVVTGR